MMQGEGESSTRVGSVKEAANFFAQKFLPENTSKPKPQRRKSAPSKFGDVHQTRSNVPRLENNVLRLEGKKNLAESVKTDVEQQPSKARKTVKDLMLQIEETNREEEAYKKELHRPRKSSSFEIPLTSVNDHKDTKHVDVVKELEQVKNDMLKLKLDMASVKESKQEAEKQISSSVSRKRSYWDSMDALRKKIEGTTQELFFLELAKMEASRETQAIEVEKESKAATFSALMEEARKKIEALTQELNQAKDLEKKLEITNSDIDVLEEELVFVKAICSITEPSSLSNSMRINDLYEEIKKREEEELITAEELESALSELKDAKKELETVEHESYKFMASMDVIREELNHITKKSSQLMKTETRYNSILHSLNSKILRGKYKLETATAAEKRAKSILLNLTATLKQLETEKESATKEKDIITEETLTLNREIQRTEPKIEQKQGKLRAAMHELENAKNSEAMALEKLKVATDTITRSRIPTSNNSTITISNFEYELLSQRAKAAEAIADKKVAAAQAWIEALKAGEKEVLMKTQMAQRKIRELQEVEKQEQSNIEKTLSTKNTVEDELSRYHQEVIDEEDDLLSSEAREVLMAPKTPKYRRPASPGIRLECRSTRKKNKKVMPSLAKILGRNKSVRRL